MSTQPGHPSVRRPDEYQLGLESEWPRVPDIGAVSDAAV